MTEKPCIICKVVKPLDQFVPDRRPKRAKQGRTNRCYDCERAYRRARHAANPERQAKATTKWQNSERGKQLGRQRAKRWADRNKPKVAAFASNRRARKRATGTHTAEELAAIRKSQRNRCIYCRCTLGPAGQAHVDHIIPLALGGSNTRENLQWLCAPCNKTKRDKNPIAFAQQMGMLL